MMLLLIDGSGFPEKAKADVIFPHASDLARIMKKNGFTQFDSKRVLYITRYFLKENPLLSTMEAAVMALRCRGFYEPLFHLHPLQLVRGADYETGYRFLLSRGVFYA